MKNSTPYLKYTPAELDAALWEIVLHARKFEELVWDVIQHSDPDDPGDPRPSPLCRFGQGDQRRDYFGGPWL